MIEIRIDPHPCQAALAGLWRAAWGEEVTRDFGSILARSLVHLGAYDGERLIGFVNIAWDGGVHASLFDTCVDPGYRHRGIATRLVKEAARLARERGAEWLHVDFDPHLAGLYRACGFAATTAGLIRLRTD